MLPKQLHQKNMIYFIEKLQRLNRRTRSLVIKRKLILTAKHSRIMAMGLYCNVENPTGSDNIVALQRTFLGRLNSVGIE